VLTSKAIQNVQYMRGSLVRDLNEEKIDEVAYLGSTVLFLGNHWTREKVRLLIGVGPPDVSVY